MLTIKFAEDYPALFWQASQRVFHLFFNDKRTSIVWLKFPTSRKTHTHIWTQNRHKKWRSDEFPTRELTLKMCLRDLKYSTKQTEEMLCCNCLLSAVTAVPEEVVCWLLFMCCCASLFLVFKTSALCCNWVIIDYGTQVWKNTQKVKEGVFAAGCSICPDTL